MLENIIIMSKPVYISSKITDTEALDLQFLILLIHLVISLIVTFLKMG